MFNVIRVSNMAAFDYIILHFADANNGMSVIALQAHGMCKLDTYLFIIIMLQQK